MLTVVLIPVTCLMACSVPVFRYALEQWASDAYEIVVFHKEPLTKEMQQVLTPYQQTSDDPEQAPKTNIQVRLVDLSGDDVQEADQKLWEAQKTDQLPWMVARYPEQLPLYFDACSAPLSESSFVNLTDSPARREIARRLLQGDTAVWVLLKTGDEEADNKAEAELKKSIELANKSLQLPEIDQQDVEDGLVTIDPDDLEINFSMLSLNKNSETEAAFIGMLTGSENDLRDYESSPLAFPIFGRGRVLYALVGDGIVEETILSSCEELIGPCTCQVKDQNPGTDLVMTVDWNNLIEQKLDLDKELPPLQGLASLTKTPTEENTTSDRERLAKLQESVKSIPTTPATETTTTGTTTEAAPTTEESPSTTTTEKAASSTTPSTAASTPVTTPPTTTPSHSSSLIWYVLIGLTGCVLVVVIGSIIVTKQKTDQ